MALALDDLTTSFSSASFAVVSQPERDLRASLATFLPGNAPGGSSASGLGTLAFGASTCGMSPPRTSATGWLGCGGGGGVSAGFGGGATGWSRGAPPNTPQGTPVSECLVGPVGGLAPAPIHAGAATPSTIMATGLPLPSGPPLLRSPPPSPSSSRQPALGHALPPSASILSMPQYPSGSSGVHCPACAYTATLPPTAPAELFPTPTQHACYTHSPGQLRCEEGAYLPSPSASPSPGSEFATIGGGAYLGGGYGSGRGDLQNYGHRYDLRSASGSGRNGRMRGC